MPQALPQNFTKAGTLKQNALQPTTHIWSSHNSTSQTFLGYQIVDVQHMTHPTTLPIHFYVLHESQTLLSCSSSDRLGIIKFNIPNEVSTSIIDTITALNQPTPKHISFSTPLHTDTPSQPQQSKEDMPKLVMKTITPQKLAPLQDHHTATLAPSQDHHTIVNICDIFALKKTFPASFNSIENMPGAYTICLDPFIPPVQHACRNILIKYHEKIEKTLQEMLDLQVIA